MKEKMKYTHEQLETAGARWLAKVGYWWSCKRIAIEPASPGSERPDVIGFAYGNTHVIECKTSRADFLRDFRKKWRTEGKKPMGACRWWLCEEGLITFDDLAGSDDGLLWITAGGNIKVIRYAAQRADEERNIVGEFHILYTLLNKEAVKPITIYRSNDGE